ncbi:hypothetical protein HYDPIDRAFT_154930 [Hydnomerulius pinastri MD-312]|uniref:Uncharacterized protein n=1 Tax=Hydnomerulius pinastri MD-312 TaxID=994086 RepID=A0A0C9W8R5_9AGAM|nr:hypothetical protein HYDPIDRAFT_154930 [Hydnomerulius pinastri MD-312]
MNPYSPQEPASILEIERDIFIGDSLSLLIYGVSLVLFVQCMVAFLKRTDVSSPNRWGLMTYTLLMFSCSTIFVALDSTLFRNAFVDYRNYPGGPIGYSVATYDAPMSITANAFFMLANWLADGLLLYRCLIVYSGRRWVVGPPLAIYFASISMGIVFTYADSRPATTAWSSSAVDFGLAYFSISCSLNIILSLMIAGRIFVYRQTVHHVLGKEHTSPYMSIAALVIESSALYAFFSILFIASYASNSNLSRIFLPILEHIQVIAPILIMLRVANKSAWTATTGHRPTGSLVFQPASQSGATETLEHDASFHLQLRSTNTRSKLSSNIHGSSTTEVQDKE